MDDEVIRANDERRKTQAKNGPIRKARQAAFDGSFMSTKTVLELIPVSRGTLDKMIARGEFPEPERVERFIVGWQTSTVQDWINQLVASHKTASQ